MFIVFYTVKIVYIVYLWLVPHPTVFWIHGKLVYIYIYIYIYIYVFKYVCMYMTERKEASKRSPS